MRCGCCGGRDNFLLFGARMRLFPSPNVVHIVTGMFLRSCFACASVGSYRRIAWECEINGYLCSWVIERLFKGVGPFICFVSIRSNCFSLVRIDAL